MHSVPDEEENAAELQFGKDFFVEGGGDSCLTIDEVCLFMKKNNGATTEVYDETKKYIERVAVSTVYEDILSVTKEIRLKLSSTQLKRKDNGEMVNLHQYEIAALASLISADGAQAEEVIAWIASLIRFDEDQIDIVVNIVAEAKRRIAGIQ